MLRNLIITDPIHQVMNYGSDEKTRSLVKKIIDSQSFQRLRRTTQLGMSSFVFPGATHSRFSHSLGVAFLARKVLSHLIEREESLRKEIKAKRRNVMIAALLHDVGHGPFSHSFENVLRNLVPNEDVPLHEDWTSAMIRFEHSEIHQILRDQRYGVEVASIASVYGFESDDPLPIYLQEIVSSQLDVDRMDYLMRDAHFAGVEIGRIDVQYLISCLSVVKDCSDGIHHLGLEPKGVKAYESYALARHLMNRSVYHHKAVNVLQFMIERIVRLVIDDMQSLKHIPAIYPFIPEYFKAILEYESYKDKDEFMHKYLDEYLSLSESQVWSLIDQFALVDHGSKVNPELIMLSKRILNRDLLKSYRVPDTLKGQLMDHLKSYPKGSYLIQSTGSTMYKPSSKKVFVDTEQGEVEVTKMSDIIHTFADCSDSERIVIAIDPKVEKDLREWFKSLKVRT